MSKLEIAIKQAFSLSGARAQANSAYLAFIKNNFFIPIDKTSQSDKPEVLYLQDNDRCFLPTFSDKKYFDPWALEIKDDIYVLTLSGIDLLKGIGDDVFVCLNIGSPNYKEFNPEEIARMRSQILKLFSN